jgi:hypothetical protein
MKLILTIALAAFGLLASHGASAQTHSQINVANSLSQYSTNTQNASITSDIMHRQLAGAEVQGLARRPAGAKMA